MIKYSVLSVSIFVGAIGLECAMDSVEDNGSRTSCGDFTNSFITCALPPNEGDMALEKVKPSGDVMLKYALGA